MDFLKNIFISLRPKQWSKNLIIFAGIAFSHNLFVYPMLLKVLLAFGLFCVLSGSVYLINDVLDLEKDKKHPRKAHRPLASGKISSPFAMGLAVVLALFSLTASFYLNQFFGATALSYFALLTLYTVLLKHLVIIDVMTIALGFVLRAIAGAVVIDVAISPWLFVCTILLALFLGISKRRHELAVLEVEAVNHRKILQEYNIPLLDQMIAVVTSSTVVAYSLYTMSAETRTKLGTPYLALTIPVVLYGLFRYLYLIYSKQQGGSPSELLLNDKPLLICVGLWGLLVVGLVYWGIK
jgi:4-hydroxybenzoate polyprenyltransferase